MAKLRKPNPNQAPPDTQTDMRMEDYTQQPTQHDDSFAPGESSRGRSTSFTEPERRLEPLRSHPPRPLTPFPTARSGEGDSAGSSNDVSKGKSSDKKELKQFPRDFNPAMFAGVCWCCGSTLVRRDLGEECVECWADQIVY
ncbi:hypothetical protein P171DRAFT_17376 [Karstenula rhodostoma CBS 690.94]|uniref:Uncharacterized protein n=1 Tax=Karstenula rhodostoma CBS 690.94 TaxID=1392251 RepID=A0A9P4UIS6_9PLEO|nr:hypothetical protein P171DRAFT_17376 [Karstenula rhodostoma CBS 690.94]